MFIDGYIIGIVIGVIPNIPISFGFNSWNLGILAAAPLMGLFLGSMLLGPATDAVGRKPLFILDLIVFLLGSVAQIWVTSPLELCLARFVLGLAIGADYAIGPALLAELMPRSIRGAALASLGAVWSTGFTAAAIASGWLIHRLGHDHWTWVLATSAIPTLGVLALRVGAPESPRWLVSKGRLAEAQDILHRFFGSDVGIDQPPASGRTQGWLGLFSKSLWRRTTFAAGFWFALAIPNYVIFLFLPRIMKDLGASDGMSGVLIVMTITLVGSIVGVIAINRMRRRPTLIGTMLVLAGCAFALGIAPNASATRLLFMIFGFVLGFAGNFEFVYPGEVFPTGLRASGVGFATAVSRIGSALGTMAVPVWLDSYGVGAIMMGTATLLMIGALLTFAWAPETHNARLLDQAP